MCSENHVLVQKMFTNGLNMDLARRAWVEKTVPGVKIHWLVKKKFRVQQVKKVMLTVCCDMKGPIIINLLEKGATVNIGSYYQLLR